MTAPSASGVPDFTVGSWFDDGWTTPYLAGRIDLAEGSYVLEAGFYAPNFWSSERTILLRHGLTEVDCFSLAPGAALQRTVPVLISKAGSQRFSVRCDQEYMPSGTDTRALGVVMQGFHVALPKVLPDTSSDEPRARWLRRRRG